MRRCQVPGKEINVTSKRQKQTASTIYHKVPSIMLSGHLEAEILCCWCWPKILSSFPPTNKGFCFHKNLNCHDLLDQKNTRQEFFISDFCDPYWFFEIDFQINHIINICWSMFRTLYCGSSSGHCKSFIIKGDFLIEKIKLVPFTYIRSSLNHQ